jgi:hypothetical protein
MALARHVRPFVRREGNGEGLNDLEGLGVVGRRPWQRPTTSLIKYVEGMWACMWERTPQRPGPLPGPWAGNTDVVSSGLVPAVETIPLLDETQRKLW